MATQAHDKSADQSSQDLVDRVPMTTPIIAQKPVTYKSELSRIADYLADDYEIGVFRDRPLKHRRYAVLRTQALFNQLVSIYSKLFKQNWEFLRRSIDGFTTAIGIRDNQWEYASRAYVSCWFHDLYVSIRNAVEKVSGTAFTQYYQSPSALISHEYDAFLVHLNAIIRPTNIKLALEDVIYIPRIAATMNISNDNPYNISPTNWNKDEDFTHSIIDRMKAPGSRWRVEPLVTDTLGRPGWLFDWHNDRDGVNKAYAWFPEEGNYSMEDVVAPHIIGEALTPNIGPRDVDDWQYYANFTRPQTVEWHRLERVTDRRFRGSSEVRTYQEEKFDITSINVSGTGTTKKRARADAQLTIGVTSSGTQAREASDEPQESFTEAPISEKTPADQIASILTKKEVDRLRIIDWTYYCCVVSRNTAQKRDGALRSFCFKQ